MRIRVPCPAAVPTPFLPRPLAAALLALAAFVPAAGAQEGTGAIRGRVVGADDVPIAQATVELSRAEGPVIRRTTTDATGAFRFFVLQPGAYRVSAHQVGFRAGPTVRVPVAAGAVETVVLQLEQLPIALEGVTAIAGPVEIRRTDTDYGTRIDERAIRLLPVGRDPQELVGFTPGARPDHVWGGSTVQANTYQLDGLTTNNPGLGGDLIEPSLGWIESIEVRGLGAGAEHGNFQGGLINVVTKRGTNTFRSALYTNLETHRFNGTNIEEGEIGGEIAMRREVDGEARGPILPDRLFYFVSGQLIQTQNRWQDQRPDAGSRFAPFTVDGDEWRFFGKLTWEPTRHDVFTGVFSRMNRDRQHDGLQGYETPEATWSLSAPVTFYSLAWDRVFSTRVWMDVSFGGFSRDERRDPYGGTEVAGFETFGFGPNQLRRNNPLRFRQAADGTSAAGSLNFAFPMGELEHRLKIGGEFSRGSWLDQRTRNAGMTWRPVATRALDPEDPSTWVFAQQFVPTTWGGDVHLDADVQNSGIYAQGSISLGSRLNLTPGLRWGHWVGAITPADGQRFEALRDAAFEPRIGATLDITGRETFVLKGHWGRYHQNMIAQFFDRIEGGNVFTNEQLWYYRGPELSDPRTAFTVAQRDSLAAQGLFTLEEEVRLNETGPVVDFRQPYVDQWLVGVEKMLGHDVKASVVYVNRSNHRMVSLVDRNLDSNYTRYESVVVFGEGGDTLRYAGYPVTLQEVYVRNDAIRELLIQGAECGFSGPPLGCVDGMPPGFTVADTSWLGYDPDHVLTNVDDARRDFGQLQFILEGSFPTWGFAGSLVFTNLTGNLDTVTGYEDPAGFGPGPYVRPNELVHRSGRLENFSSIEYKMAAFTELAWGFRGGAYWTRATGEYFSPQFTISGLQNSYRVRPTSEQLDRRMFLPVAGQRVLVETRGAQNYKRRASLDLRLERTFPLIGAEWTLTADVFNLFNFSDVTDVNTSVNRGLNFLPFLPLGDPNAFFMAVRERVPPRTIRIGGEVRLGPGFHRVHRMD